MGHQYVRSRRYGSNQKEKKSESWHIKFKEKWGEELQKAMTLIELLEDYTLSQWVKETSHEDNVLNLVVKKIRNQKYLYTRKHKKTVGS